VKRVVLVVALFLISPLLACSSAVNSPQVVTPTIYTPHYSQSDVVYLAQQSNPGVPYRDPLPYSAKFTALYQGNYMWQLKKEIGSQRSEGFYLYWYQYGSLNELTGEIVWGGLVDARIIQPIFQ